MLAGGMLAGDSLSNRLAQYAAAGEMQDEDPCCYDFRA
jgi:hypothetical protein